MMIIKVAAITLATLATLTFGLGRVSMHGVAPRRCCRVASPLLNRGAGGRSPGLLFSAADDGAAATTPFPSLTGMKLPGALAARFVIGAAIFHPPHFGADDFARLRDLVVRFALDPASWRNLNGRDTVEQIVVISRPVANGFWGTA